MNKAPGIQQTELTPELAAKLLANPHPRQRRASRQVVNEYARRIKEGRWRLIHDHIMMVGPTFAGPDDPLDSLFNGGQRCAAVIAANRSIPVYIDWDADPSLFDVIDIGRFRSAFQFVSEKDATSRAAAARVTLWYERRFERPLGARHIAFDLHEILAEAERRSEAFDAVMGAARALYDYTTIAKSISLAAFALAEEMGYREEIEAFVAAIRDPSYLPAGDPAKLLAERFRKQDHRARRREMVDDWTILVRAFNLQLEGRAISKLVLTRVWPRVAESEADYKRRSQAAFDANRVQNEGRRSGAKRVVGAA